MASANFTTAESPLSSPWTTVTGGGGLRATGGECANSAGSDTDSAAYYSTSSATTSFVEFRGGTFDGGPAFFDSIGNGYLPTCYSGSTVELYRIDAGFPNYNRLGTDAAVSFSAGDVAKFALVGNDVVFYKNNVEIFRQTDSTYRTGLKPAIFAFAANLRVDNWGDGAAASYTLTAAQGSYTMTGQAVGLKAARTVGLSQGSYTLNGQSVGLIYSGATRTLTAAQGSYSLNGQAVGLRADRRMTLSSGSYALNGQAVALKVARKTALSQGSYALNGQSVTLSGPIVGFSMAIGQGSYNLTGSDAAVDLSMNIGTGSYTLTGRSVGLAVGHKTQLSTGAYSYTGSALALRAARSLPASSGNYSLTGNDIGLTQHAPAPRLTVGSGSYGLFGNQVNLLYSGNKGEIFHSLPLNWWTKGL